MKVTISTRIEYFPITISLRRAISFHREEAAKHDVLMVMARGWRNFPELGEESWFEELTADELEDDDFETRFARAEFQLWMR